MDVPVRLVPIRPVLIVIDEGADVLSGVGLPKSEAVAVRESFGVLARQGRACGMHLVLSITRPDVDAIPGAIRDQFAGRISLGPLSPDGARMLFGTHQVPPMSQGAPGSGLALGLDGQQRVRRISVPWATITDVRNRHGLGASPFEDDNNAPG